MKNTSSFPIVLVGASLALAAVILSLCSCQMALASPTAYSKDQLTAMAPNEDNEMAAAESELASLQEPSNMADGEVDESDFEDQVAAPMAATTTTTSGGSNNQHQQQQQRWADNSESYEPNGQDSNIENAKIHMGPSDQATAAGHHHYGGHHGGHYVSGKMSMGAHSGHKGAFGWHAKFPVGGKGRR